MGLHRLWESLCITLEIRPHRSPKRCATLLSEMTMQVDVRPPTIPGYEVMHMIRKGQVRWLMKGDVDAQVLFINTTLGLKSV